MALRLVLVLLLVLVLEVTGKSENENEDENEDEDEDEPFPRLHPLSIKLAPSGCGRETLPSAFSTPIGAALFQMSLQPSEINRDEVKRLAAEFESVPLAGVLRWLWERFGARAAIGTSFQGAGLVMIDHALKAGLRFPVFTLDTNLLFPETYELKARLEKHWGIDIEGLQPELNLEQQAADYGAELWKKAPDVCCTLRKVVPLQKKLSQLGVWITGLRRQQSDTREATQILELYHFDVLRDLYILKANPMAPWARETVWEYIRANGIPYNPLHDRGYHSIGCWPCTRATDLGENERAGRWTGFDKAECGIHTFLGDSI